MPPIGSDILSRTACLHKIRDTAVPRYKGTGKQIRHGIGCCADMHAVCKAGSRRAHANNRRSAHLRTGEGVRFEPQLCLLIDNEG